MRSVKYQEYKPVKHTRGKNKPQFVSSTVTPVKIAPEKPVTRLVPPTPIENKPTPEKPAERQAIAPWIAAQHILQELQEPRPYKKHTLKYVCKLLLEMGLKQVIELVIQAQELHKTGECMTKDGSRQRALSGVFFLLVKQKEQSTDTDISTLLFD